LKYIVTERLKRIYIELGELTTAREDNEKIKREGKEKKKEGKRKTFVESVQKVPATLL